MKTDLFFIAPSESILTGLCLEEYLGLRRTNATTSFFQVSHSRIEPFVPEALSIRRTRINVDDIPGDLEWLPIQDMKIGRRASEPNTFYGIDEQGAYRKKILYQRFFLALLTDLLLPHLGVAEWMRSLSERASHDLTALATDLLSGIVNDEEQNPAKVGIMSEDENPAEIEKAIIGLIEYNETQRFFNIGRSFGGLIAGLQMYERNHDPCLTLASIGRFLCELIAFPEIERSAVARSALANIASIFEREREAFEPVWNLIARSLDEGQLNLARLAELKEALCDEKQAAFNRAFEDQQRRERREAVLPLIQRMWPAVWVAFGEILGAIRDLDQDSKDHDAAKVTPRTFLPERNDTLDRLGQWLIDFEQELAEYERQVSHGPSSFSTPEKVIVGLKDHVEALTKRLWKREFDKTYRGTAGGLPSLLLDKVRLGNSTKERRFAQIALSLYKGYRNELTHDQDEFNCSLSEARYFLSGVRVLLELYREILARAP